MIWNCLAAALARRLNRSRTGCRRCNAPAPRGFRSFLCASIRRARSPSGTRPRHCNLPATAAPVRCGTCTAAFETPGQFLRQLAETPTARATFAWPATSRNRRVVSGAGAPLCDRFGLRDTPCGCVGLRRSHGYCRDECLCADRNFMPYLRAQAMPPAVGAAD